MRTHNICFHGKIRKISILVGYKKWLIWIYAYQIGKWTFTNIRACMVRRYGVKILGITMVYKLFIILIKVHCTNRSEVKFTLLQVKNYRGLFKSIFICLGNT